MAPKKVKDDPQTQPATATPVILTNATAREDDVPLQGHFVEVVSGEHEGRYGVFESVGSTTAAGYPTTIVVVTRDDDSERLVLRIEDCRPAVAGGR